MYAALLYIVGCAKENKEYMKTLTNPYCNISEYTRKLVAFYEDNVTKLDAEEITKVFDILKEVGGKTFFNKETGFGEK